MNSKRLLAAVTLALVGCASTGPAPLARLGLKLAPSALGESVSLQQHLTVERAGASTNSMPRSRSTRPGSRWSAWRSASAFCRSITTART